jgi:hypothetical protein
MELISMSHRGIAVLGAAAVIAASLVAAAPAEAAETSTFQRVTAADPTVVSQAVDVTPTTDTAVAVSADVAGTHVAVPTKASDGVRLGDLSVTLPYASHAGGAVPVGDGAVVYDNHNGTSTVPVVISDAGVQINTTIADSAAPRTFTYDFSSANDASLTLDAESGIVTIADNESNILGIIAPAWAKDADGNAVPTHYEVDGATLTQVVDLDQPGVAYPVVADPLVTLGITGTPYGPGFYLNLTGLQMKSIAAAAVLIAGATAIAICSGAAKLPSVVSRIAAVACTAVGSATVKSLLTTVSKIANNGKYADKSCYQTLMSGSHPFVKTASSNCS